MSVLTGVVYMVMRATDNKHMWIHASQMKINLTGHTCTEVEILARGSRWQEFDGHEYRHGVTQNPLTDCQYVGEIS